MKKRIFLVEDESIVAKDVEGILKSQGYEVVGIADTGKKALSEVEKLAPDVILMDIRIKGPMDGIDTAKEIQKKHDIPIIYVTAYADDKTLGRAKITGPFGYIVKPFQERELKTAIEVASYKHKMEQENRRLSEKIIKLTKVIPLTNKEKQVFYAMIRYPDYTDIMISKMLGIKRSTITAIRNRFRNENLIETYRVPDFERLGCEMMTCTYSEVNKGINRDILMDAVKKNAKIPEQLVMMSTYRRLAGISVAKNFTEFRKYFDDLTGLYKEKNITDGMNVVHFPFQLSQIKRFFDYSRFVKGLFELEIKDKPQPRIRPKAGIRNLSSNEHKILVALVENRNSNDSQIADMLRMPRTTVSQIRRRLYEEGLVSTVNIPNLVELRCELIVFTHIVLRSDTVDLKKAHAYFESRNSTVFLASKNLELFHIDVYSDYNDYENQKNIDEKFYIDNSILIEKEADNIFTVPQLQFKKIDFMSMTEKLK